MNQARVARQHKLANVVLWEAALAREVNLKPGFA